MSINVAKLCVLILSLGFVASKPTFAQSAFMSDHMPYDAFEALPKSQINVGGSVLNVAIAPGDLALSRQSILAWLEKSAKAVTVYYGHFPVTSAKILIVPVPGSGLRGGQAFGYRGAAIRLMLGRDSTEDDLVRDWKAVHEMVHLALPDVAQSHLWLAEGLAVYIESIARVQAGDLPDTQIWRDFVRDMPHGLPEAGDRGLDATPTWGRTYWGGAMFCLMADVEIRKRTQNKIGLQEALRGILASGGTHEQDWPIERIIRVADTATGTTVLAELYDKMRAAPYAPDLGEMWRGLGVSAHDGTVSFDNDAPLAAVRRAITAAPEEARRL